ncbi:thiol oxidoreductase [Bdellovibrio sp. qaytius]|nr:thiol oxidoreductase [Bdellovibrio sp. qaytius]
MFSMNKLTLLFFSALLIPLCGLANPKKPGGEGSTRSETIDAFSLPMTNISAQDRKDFFVGKSFFRQNWIELPASVKSLEGLGPTFIARSCVACHDRDGRGRPPEVGEEFRSLLFRISKPGEGPHGGPNPVENYGDQIQNFGISNVPAEAKPQIKWIESHGTFDDGTPYTLVKPEITFKELAFGELPKDVMISPRVAQAMYGLGLLEAISDKDILANVDSNDSDQDGIKGKANYVWNQRAEKMTIGRFGWKANQPTLLQQTAGAFLGDMGINTSIFSAVNCPSVQIACLNAPKKKTAEMSDKDLNRVTKYTQLLSVPERRIVADEIEIRGQRLVQDLACIKCHVPHFRTADFFPIKELRGQEIFPYTDLLLHDMGEGLADNRQDFRASGREWRTAPLWGIGLIKKVNKHTRFLHDGRARNLEEAILWHGGEAEVAKNKYKGLSADDRNKLITYLESL